MTFVLKHRCSSGEPFPIFNLIGIFCGLLYVACRAHHWSDICRASVATVHLGRLLVGKYCCHAIQLQKLSKSVDNQATYCHISPIIACVSVYRNHHGTIYKKVRWTLSWHATVSVPGITDMTFIHSFLVHSHSKHRNLESETWLKRDISSATKERRRVCVKVIKKSPLSKSINFRAELMKRSTVIKRRTNSGVFPNPILNF